MSCPSAYNEEWGNKEGPLPEEFEQFMRFSAGLDHHNILCYNGVFFLESLQMPLMTGSVRQYMEGRTVKCDGRKVKPKSSNGWGSMRPKVVKQVAVGVANDLFYLHSQKGFSHDGQLLQCPPQAYTRVL